MTVKEFLDRIEDYNTIITVKAVIDDEWKVVSSTPATMMGVPDDVMESEIISWGVYDGKIMIRI